MAKQITYHEDARFAVLGGVDKLPDAVTIAGLMLTTEAMVSNLDGKEPKGTSLRSGDMDDLD